MLIATGNAYGKYPDFADAEVGDRFWVVEHVPYSGTVKSVRAYSVTEINSKTVLCHAEEGKALKYPRDAALRVSHPVLAGQMVNAILMMAQGRILLYHETSRLIMMEMAMTTAVREKFSSQAAPEVLAALRQIAESQGRQFQTVLDEALRDYIDRQQKERPRRHAMTSFASSLDEFDSLYRELAK
ncbi:hypothetical protein [Acidithiobacillus ferridurans]|uniref:hypothetical protein n=1 Tax=Acidithiobacillus ferridurans TaxID=1232575 RepID=UPI001D01B909|nr:hypothetical protein [Acidithiobacillus ferridurans]